MKKFTYIMLFCLPLLFISCNAKTARSGKQIGEKLYKEYRAVSESEGAKAAKKARRVKKIENMYETYTNDDPVLTPKRCGQCGGAGWCYVADGYGNVIRDCYGNAMTTICSACEGSGTIYVYE